jgi:lysophospholipase L1-like esterase
MIRFKRLRVSLSFAALLAVCVAGGSPARAAAPVRTYIALGDSVAFGQTDVLPVSDGSNQGYVGFYANSLAAEQDGVRPQVINLGIPGETSDSFFTATPPRPDWVRNIGFNTNYTSPLESQFLKLLSTIAAEKAAGHRITHVSLALGANDYFALLGSAQFNAPGADQAALIRQTLLNIQRNYAFLLTTVRTLLPKAKLLLLTYYNAFTVFGPEDFLNQLTEATVQGHSQIVRGMAKAFKGKFVDVHTAFQGHETEYTHILGVFVGLPLDVAFHPSNAGYAVIAQAMAAED